MIRTETTDKKSNIQQALSENTKRLLKKIKFQMTKQIKASKTQYKPSKNDKHTKYKIKAYKKGGPETNRYTNRYTYRPTYRPTYIDKLIDNYYNNDSISNKYVNTAHKKLHILPNQRRMIVFGDIHGDLEAAIECFIIAGCIKKITLPTNKTVINMNNFFNTIEWIGEDTYVVQLGDQIDRVRPQKWDHNDITRDNAFKDEGSTLEILYLFYYLNELAQKQRGRVFSIIGNHEIMNIEADFRYVSLKEFKCFKQHLKNTYKKNSKFPYNSNTLKNNSYKFKHLQTKKSHHNKKSNYNNKNHNNKIEREEEFTNVPEGFRERLYAFSPTGLCSNLIGANNYVILQIGNWLFCHGGPVLETINTYSMDLINNIVSMYLLGIDNNKKYIETHYNNITKTKHNNNILWNREFGEVDINNIREQELTHQLDTVLNGYNNKNSVNYKATHIAIGHTTQYSANKGINSICDGRVWRCDVGMSRAFGNRTVYSHRNPQVLEILNSDGKEIINVLQ